MCVSTTSYEIDLLFIELGHDRCLELEINFDWVHIMQWRIGPFRSASAVVALLTRLGFFCFCFFH